MESLRRTQLESLLSKCEDALSRFKKKRRDTFVTYGDATRYDNHITRLLSLTTKVSSELRDIVCTEEHQCIDRLLNKYTLMDLQIELRTECENIDKEIWYIEHFDNWTKLPERQACETYPLKDRVEYSRCRQKMFDHLESEWKTKTFPTLAHRLEFF